ncbi:MAG: 3-hydroxybutyryl-CoA dehydrogenase [Flavobacteriales bacterium]|nr:3-hydroxybutyryl-CoA dehydrogenase [Flavobacteriales bacterium]
MIVGVIGAGTMGSGIAQVAAQAGHPTVLFDTRKEAVDKAVAGLQRTLDKLVEKGKLDTTKAKAIGDRITPATDIKALAGCGLVIEAIVEDLAVKKRVFSELEALLSPDALLASNTSSLSITAIAAACSKPGRVVGLHFFNPAPLMPLVEVVPGVATDPRACDAARLLMTDWGKVPVTCKDTPGFIVNRVARPYYGESIRLYEEGVADMATIDHALKTFGGFRMGPFELMDLIGNDINFTVTRTVWESFFYEPRYRPSFTQQRMVEAGWLGRKTGRGYFTYDEKGQPAASAAASVAPELGDRIVERVLAMLINEAADALHLGVATKEDIDLAMTKGVNYPKGLLAWADEKGAAHWLAVLETLQAEFGEDRYRPSPLLRRMARNALRFH